VRARDTVLSVNRARALLRRRLFDVVIVAAAVGAVLELVLGRNSAQAPDSALWLALPAALLLILPLLARRRGPFVVPAGMLVFATAISFVDGRIVPYSFFVFLSALAICFLFGLLEDRRQAIAGLALTLAMGLIGVRNDPGHVAGDFAFIPLIFGIVWFAGFALGHKLAQAREATERASRAEAEREERAQAAVADERRRIARELHDVVAHSVSVMTVQAGGVRRLLLPEQTREREALLAIEETGRTALAEMRRLLGILRGANETPSLAPQPGMRTLGALVEQVREAGLPVEYRIEGEPVELPPGIDLSAYRIVQEALTNALRHAGPARARVFVRYRGTRLELEIENDGTGEANGDGGGAGQGLVGMQQRVELYGGRLAVGPRAGGNGYRVRAVLPIKEAP
jgi:signal transduction histidine kinase